VLIIGMLDPLGIITPIRADSAWNGIVWELYVFVGVFFFIFCFSMSRYSMYLEKKLKTDR
jgi:general L-amino acid transport system permease protein